MKVCVLLSGGMDSVVALYEAHQSHDVVACLSFDYGSKHNAREIPFAALHASRLEIPHHVISLDFINQLFKSDLLKSGGAIPDGHYAEDSMKQTVVPFRNGIMLSIAAGFAESIDADAIVIAAHSGDHAIYPDCREPFMQAMCSAIQNGTYANLEILRPFIHHNKAGIARRGAELGIHFEETWSCYKGDEIHCGSCGTCVERREAFLHANLPDPTKYLNLPSI
jgi:7-cyano-7-deazaguanine synthase